MGVVYEGRDPNLERRVAIKTVKVENLSEAAAAEYEGRFRTEARSAARLQHPNIVSVYDSDRHGDTAYLVMEFVQGEDLKHYIDRGKRYTFDETLRIMSDLLSALDYAHKQNIVHRDIKPANLLMEPSGRIKLTDFGVARIADSGEATRTKGAIVGTLKYMAPEQVQGLAVDSRADLFSAGVVLYQLLTDKRPFDGDNDFSIIHQIISNVPALPSGFNRALPPAIDAVVEKALAKDRNLRFATAAEFQEALQSAARQMDDTTIIPPADPLRQLAADAASIGTKGSNVMTNSNVVAGVATNTGSTVSNTAVTQELELVYWKDVKDSSDPEELHGFLARFPTGIYADLARRRLKKLGDGPASPDDTTTRLMAVPVARAAGEAPPEPAAPAEAAAAAQPAAAVVAAVPPKVQARAPEPAPAVAAAAPASAAGAEIPRKKKKKASGGQGTEKAPAPKSLVYGMVGAGIALVAIAFISLKPASRPVEPPVAAASAPAPAAAPSPAAALPAVPPPPLTATPASATVASASKPAGAASRPGRPASPSARPASRPVQSTPPHEAVVRTEEPRPQARAAAPASTPAAPATAVAGGPKAACDGRILIGFEICMKEQCEKPAFSNHAVCVERREMDRRRRERQMLP